MKLDEIKDPKLKQRIQDALAGAASLQRQLNESIAQTTVKKKRIRQHKGTGLNKNETEALEYLKAQYGLWDFRPHAIRLEIANGCQFTPDIVMMRGNDMVLYEVKGKHAWDDSIVKLKVVARQWKIFAFALIWKQDGRWMEQAIFP